MEATPSLITAPATIKDLQHHSGKAELVQGKLLAFPPTGFLPNFAAGEIYVSLRQYARVSGSGYALTDNAGFLVDLPSRSSFSPDASFYIGTPSGMRYLSGAPVFAVEVCNGSDRGQAMEDAMAEKRRDYFLAGTEVVWDVDLQAEEIVRKYMAGIAEPTVYRRGEAADAEPALAGWQLAIDDLFPQETGKSAEPSPNF